MTGLGRGWESGVGARERFGALHVQSSAEDTPVVSGGQQRRLPTWDGVLPVATELPAYFPAGRVPRHLDSPVERGGMGAPGLPSGCCRLELVFLGWGPGSSCDPGGVWGGGLGGSAFGLSLHKPWGGRRVWGACFLHDPSIVSLNVCRKLPRGPGWGWGQVGKATDRPFPGSVGESYTPPSTVPLGHPGPRPCLLRLACPAGLCVNFAGPTCLGGSWG